MERLGKYDKDLNEIEVGDVLKVKVCGKKRFYYGTVKFFPEYGIYAVAEKVGDVERPLGSSGSSTNYKPYNWKSYSLIEIIER